MRFPTHTFDGREMKKTLLALGALAMVACQDVSVPTNPSLRAARTIGASTSAGTLSAAGRHIVVFKTGVSDAPGLSRALVALHGGVLYHTYQYAVKGFAAELPDAAVVLLRRRSDVAYVEEDAIMSAVVTQTGATWGLDRIDQRDLPLSTTYSYTTTGNGVNAYIIDTGIWTTHVEFGGRASSVFDAIGDGNGGSDCNGHGTHVSGTVGGATYGVAKQVSLYSVRVLDCSGSGLTSGVIAGIDWVTGNRVLPAVANMSLGGSASATLDQAVRNSIMGGVTYAIAAGNDNLTACNASPARVAEAITVGATTTTDARSSFSNFGTCVDVFAPGSGITSSYRGSDTQTAVLSGTSMASPHVAGAVARYLQANPTATPAAVAAALTGAATSGKVTNPGTGSPNLLLYASFADASSAPPVARFTWSCPGLTCTLDGTTSTDDIGIVSYFWDLGKSPGPTATGSVVTATYPHAGPRTVTLTVTDGSGQVNSVTQVITVGGPPPNQPPVAAFTSSCTNLVCSFDSSGSSDDVGITNRSWTFGDGTTAGNVVAPGKTYAAAGTYSVTLTVTDGGGLSNAITKSVTVTAAPPVDLPPVARFTWSCPGLTCTLDATTSTDDIGIVSYFWNLDKFPAPTATGSIVSATYPHTGPRTITLTVTDGSGQVNSITQVVTVGGPPPNQPPVAAFTFSCTNLACSFDSSGSSDDVGITNRSWTFGDGTTAGNVVSPGKTYAAAGTYDVTLTVTDGGGLSNAVTRSVTVTAVPPPDQPPVARFTWSCPNLTCTLDATTSTDDIGIVSYFWDLNKFPGPTATGSVVTATYPHSGTRSVTLTVTDTKGQTNSVTQVITIP